MDISTNQKPTIYRNLYENTGPDSSEVCNASHDRKTVWDDTKADVFKVEVQLAIHENSILE